MHKKFNLSPMEAGWVLALFVLAVFLATQGNAVASFIIVTGLACFVIYAMRRLINSMVQQMTKSAAETQGLFAEIQRQMQTVKEERSKLLMDNAALKAEAIFLRTETESLRRENERLKVELNVERAKGAWRRAEAGGFGQGNNNHTRSDGFAPGAQRPSGKRDYYEVLGVARDATADQIKAAFRKRAMECHPDRHPGDKVKEAEFKEINEAHEVLKDPEKRKYYDRFGEAPKAR